MTDPKVLRNFFNEIFSENIKDIRQAYKLLNVSNKEDAYALLEKEYAKYNTVLQNEEKQKVIQRSKAKAKTSAEKVLQNVKAKQQQPKKSVLTTQLKHMKNKKLNSITIDLKGYKSISQALNNVLTRFERVNPNVKYSIVVGNIHYPINFNTRQKLIEMLKGDLIDTTEDQGSDADIAIQIKNVKQISIEIFTPSNKYNKHNGAFFKYIHNTQFDFSDYQIYNKLIKSSNDMPYSKALLKADTPTFYDNCLIHALVIDGLSDEKIQALRLKCKANNIPVCKLNEICNELNIRINLKKMKTQTETEIVVFGKDHTESYNIGLLDEHFFIINDTNITYYCMDHYEEVKDLPNCNHIVEKNGKYYKRNQSKTMDSFRLVKFLLDNKEKFLTCLNKLDVAYTQHYSKVNDIIETLNYTPLIDNTFRPVETAEQRMKRRTTQKEEETEQKQNKKQDDIYNIYFDFETFTIDGVHVPYLCCFEDDFNNSHCFQGEDCGLQMLKYLSVAFKKNKKTINHLRMIAHNSSYDIRFLYKHLNNISEITKGSKVMSCKATFNNLRLEIKDSLSLITMPLRNFPKTFKIDNCIKEVISYKMYNETDCLKRQFIPVEEGLEWLKKENKDTKQFLHNIEKWHLVNANNEYDCIEYSKHYCLMDCKILQKGYNTFRMWMLELVKIDINNILTIASLAHRYFIEQGCYIGVNELSGVSQMFIQKCVVGGRVMCANNEKVKLSGTRIMDFDAVSLYPSAMKRMDGFLKGLPKVIENVNYDNLKNKDGYFIEIKINSVGIKRKFPLLSYVNENGIRIFTNDIVGRNVYVDKTTLEDAIKFQKITFEIIRGYYFDEGLNNTINNVIDNIFNERVCLKKNKNPAEIVYKLIMNSGYGKSIMKEIETETKYFNNDDEMKVFISRNYNWVLNYENIYDSTLQKVKLIKSVSSHFNIAQVGVSILSWSKRIMNEVICLAEDNNLNIYYQDTDSIHINETDIAVLADKYKEQYNKELIGNQMGQFHSDFDLEGCENIYANRSIFLGKKCYIDELKGTNKDGIEQTGFHIRMKGIPSSCITWTAQRLGYNNVFELYEDLYKGKTIEFDLTQQHTKDNFKFNTNGTVITLDEFKRRIRF